MRLTYKTTVGVGLTGEWKKRGGTERERRGGKRREEEGDRRGERSGAG